MLDVQLVVAHEAGGDRHAFWTVSFPGLVGGITCLSEKGVFAAVHDVNIRPKTMMTNLLPRLVALRAIVEQASPENALQKAHALCRESGTLYGNNFHVAAVGGRAGVVEYDSDESIDKGATLRLPDGGSHLTNTNHHRKRRKPSSCFRYARLEETFALLSAQSVKIGLREMKVLIGAAEVPMTMHQVVVDLEAKEARLALQTKPGKKASTNGYKTLRWRDVFPKK
jgi:hypothetical protein